MIIITAFGGRRFCFDKYVDGLLALDYPKDKITYVVSDGSGEDLRPELEKIGSKFKAFHYIKDERKPMVGITAGEPFKSERIASVYDRIREKTKTLEDDFVLSIEDDIVAPSNGIKKLLDIMKDESVGVSFGRQICRWMECPLVWKIDFKSVFGEKDTAKEVSPDCKVIPVKDTGIEEVDGMPMGFNLIRKELFDRRQFRANDYGITGYDLIFSVDIKKWGYKVVVDWSIHCKHYHDYTVKSPFGSFNIKKELV